MTRRAETELLARLLLAAALVAAVWLMSAWLRSRGVGNIIAAVALVAIAPAIAAAPQPVVRLVLAASLAVGLPAVALRTLGAQTQIVIIDSAGSAQGQVSGPTPFIVAAWLLPAAVIGMPVGLLLRCALKRMRRADPDLPLALASAAAIVMAYPMAGLIGWGIYLVAQHLLAAPLGSIAPLAGCTAAIGAAAWAWPVRLRGGRTDV